METQTKKEAQNGFLTKFNFELLFQFFVSDLCQNNLDKPLTQVLAGSFIWRWRESNPRPSISPPKSLRS